jgi:Retroviral aspartyl protease
MSEKFAKLLKLKPQPTSQEVNLTSANSSPIESKGVVDVDLSIQGLTVPFTFYVLRSLSHPVILGTDFLKASSAIIDCAKSSIMLYDGLIQADLTTMKNRQSVLRLSQAVIIPAATEALVKLFVPDKFKHKDSLID